MQNSTLLSQKGYVQNILNQFGIKLANTAPTPIVEKAHTSTRVCDELDTKDLNLNSMIVELDFAKNQMSRSVNSSF